MRSRLIALATVAASWTLFVADGALARGSYDQCGEVKMTAGSKILKVKRMSCANGKRIGKTYERRAFDPDNFPMPGDATSFMNWRCVYEGYFDPFEPAYTCRNSGRKSKAVRALYPPEREPVSAGKYASFETCAVQVSGECEVKPRKVISGARTIIRKLDWGKTWGSRKAVGNGRFRYAASAGDPEGSSIKTRGQVVYTKIRGCGSRSDAYSHIEITYGKALKKKWVDFDIFKPCSG